MSTTRDYKDLVVWQRAMELAAAATTIARTMRGCGAAEIRSQIIRAAVSVPANIAEGHSRAHRKEFLQFLAIARASLKELETHLLLAERCAFIPPGANSRALDLADEVSRMLTVMKRRLAESGDTSAQR